MSLDLEQTAADLAAKTSQIVMEGPKPSIEQPQIWSFYVYPIDAEGNTLYPPRTFPITDGSVSWADYRDAKHRARAHADQWAAQLHVEVKLLD